MRSSTWVWHRTRATVRNYYTVMHSQSTSLPLALVWFTLMESTSLRWWSQLPSIHFVTTNMCRSIFDLKTTHRYRCHGQILYISFPGNIIVVYVDMVTFHSNRSWWWMIEALQSSTWIYCSCFFTLYSPNMDLLKLGRINWDIEQLIFNRIYYLGFMRF